MRKRRKKKQYRQTTISVNPSTFEILWAEKDRLTKVIGRRVTWDGLLEQAVLILEASYLLPSAKAIRYNPYIYGVECPSCGAEEYPLRRDRRVVWKVKCSKCGIEYIALA